MRKYPGRRRAVISTIREARIEANISQRALSTKLKEAATYMHEVERGQHGVRVEEFIAIAEAIGADPVDLLKRILKRA